MHSLTYPLDSSDVNYELQLLLLAMHHQESIPKLYI